MKTGRNANRVARVLILCVMLALALGCTAVSCAESPFELSIADVCIMSKCDATFDGNSITITNEEFNEDVWSPRY